MSFVANKYFALWGPGLFVVVVGGEVLDLVDGVVLDVEVVVVDSVVVVVEDPVVTVADSVVLDEVDVVVFPVVVVDPAVENDLRTEETTEAKVTLGKLLI